MGPPVLAIVDDFTLSELQKKSIRTAMEAMPFDPSLASAYQNKNEGGNGNGHRNGNGDTKEMEVRAGTTSESVGEQMQESVIKLTLPRREPSDISNEVSIE